MTAVVVEGLRKAYGSRDVLLGIDFAVTEGEIFALLGPNGAGKTTTLEILEGFRGRDEGRVEVLGMDPRSSAVAHELRERVGIVLQDTAVEPYLSVRETIARDAGYYRAPRDVDGVIELVGLREKRRAKVKDLSGGQKRRLDLALGVVGNPSLLFLDEPTTGFDPSARRSAWELVRDLRDSGTTIVLTTHYMDEVQALADSVTVIADGRIVDSGTPATLGGRDKAFARIRFELPPGTGVLDLPLPTAPPVVDGMVHLEVREPTAVLHSLTGWALERGTTLGRLTVERPSLEDVYLEITRSFETGEAAQSQQPQQSAAVRGRRRKRSRT
ncbi:MULTISPECIES: ABC transporter ATP-binding protein [Streptomyces]|uniref:ABC transporter ATP-binding protein n=1 Tax=Streptomyces TaxID=1883 RepID=UPI0003AACFA0|nr:MULTISPECIES: ABC transporter ATP-binding protein [Streptomyces]MBZ6110506.1 ABC transporter ATP-binding protein [Streptomyces olivaceus]MBZ6123475.1 ABC transporter ATP-binding protein [Streptomyces olivaceus]MBZ6148932.1 ABC transporter ATP-binding protein [Streptomyces olivaceus]MBZ6159183.1 ABC transporter ATP-binding protein [Streptomyces olivaceus]MBZ6188457.1 ABC transporter ATP-binding protein [Streptomyces olivaceus]